MTPIDIRKKAQEFALQTISAQRDQFLTMGLLGNWQDPYTTMNPKFEANEVSIYLL